jgi:hypothetical protein
VGEAARRRQAHASQLADRLLAIPEPVRAAIAAEVASVTFDRLPPGGACGHRAGLARQLLAARLGLVVPMVAGAMLYAGGDDLRRHLVAFCGPDGELAISPAGCRGHWWLEVGGVILDFSPPDWRRERGGLSQFDMPPPRYVWGQRGQGFVLPSAPGVPPPGRAYYRKADPIPPLALAALAELERLEAAFATPAAGRGAAA